MRLTIINQFYAPDVAPTGHLAASLAAHRAGRGDEVTVVTGRGAYLGGSAAQVQETPGVRVHRLWTPGLGKKTGIDRLMDYFGFYAAATARLASLAPQDVIVSLTTPPYIVASALGHKLLHRGTRVVLWSMDCYPDALEADGVIPPGGFASRTLRALNRRLFAHLDSVVCLDEAMRERVAAYLPRRTASHVIPNWEKLEMFPDPVAIRPWPEAAELGLDRRLVILYLGNTGRGHEFETVLEAARRLKEAPVVFLFVGGGSAWPQLAARKREFALDNVLLHGYVPKETTPLVLASAQCALITMRDAMRGVISPSKLHSSLAMGLPIAYVGPKGSNVDEAVREFRCGVSLRARDVDGLVGFVHTLIRAPAELAGMRHRARAAFETSYCDRVVLPLFDALIEGRAGGPAAEASATVAT